MPNIQAISRARHGNKCWLRSPNYAFAGNDAIAAVQMHELPSAVLSMPIAFFEAGTGYSLVAVQSFQPGKNLFVAPDGRWVGGYIPVLYRGYPFVLGTDPEGKQLLCIDEDSGLLTDAPAADALPSNASAAATTTPATEAFFAEDNQPSPAVAEVFSFLTQAATHRQATQLICATLQKYALIKPWPIKVQTDAGEQNIEGLFCIDESALNALPEAAFLELRTTGALPLAYCQLLSMQHLPLLTQLSKAHATAQAATQAAAAKAAPKPLLTPKGDLDLEFLNNNGTISFGNLFK